MGSKIIIIYSFIDSSESISDDLSQVRVIGLEGTEILKLDIL